MDDYLPAATAAGENATEPISPATMGPLLVWALKFIEEFAADILAAHDEEHRLRQVIDRHLAQPFPHGPRPSALAAYLEDLQARGKPLPAQSAVRGRPQPRRRHELHRRAPRLPSGESAAGSPRRSTGAVTWPSIPAAAR